MNNETDIKYFTLIIKILVLCIGVFIRFYHLMVVGFSAPWELGGLFLEFSRQIFKNNYLLPINIPNYTLGGLPFAYPPLPFFIQSFLVFTLGLPEFFIVNFLPPFVSVLSLFLFYYLVMKHLKSPYSQLISIILFSLSPICFIEQVEGAGLAESFGTIFIILMLITFWDFYKDPLNFRRLILTSLIWALGVMASPASAYVSIIIFLAIVIIMIFSKQFSLKKLLLHILLLTIIAILISSFYWGTVIKNHGLNVIMESFSAQHGGNMIYYGVYSLMNITNVDLIRSEPIIAFFFLFSICILVYYKNVGLLMLSIFSLLIPREQWIMGIIGVFIIGYSSDLIFQNTSLRLFRQGKKSPSLLVGLLILFLISTRLLLFSIERELLTPDNSLDSSQIEFLENINDINPSEKNLIIIGGDTFLEWSPYLSEMTVLNVPYGTEFAPEKSWIFEVNESLRSCDNLQCIIDLLDENYYSDMFVVIDMDYLNQFELEGDFYHQSIEAINLFNDRYIYFTVETSV